MRRAIERGEEGEMDSDDVGSTVIRTIGLASGILNYSV